MRYFTVTSLLKITLQYKIYMETNKKAYWRWTTTRRVNDSCNQCLESRGGREGSFCAAFGLREYESLQRVCGLKSENEGEGEGHNSGERGAEGLPCEAAPQPELRGRSRWDVRRWMEGSQWRGRHVSTASASFRWEKGWTIAGFAQRPGTKATRAWIKRVPWSTVHAASETFPEWL